MTSNQRRPGFRLPWAAEGEESVPAEGQDAPQAVQASEPAAATADAPEAAVTPAAEAEVSRAQEPATEAAATDAATPAEPQRAEAPTPATAPAPAAEAASQPELESDFLRDLVAAMRRVADEARQSGVAELHARTDEQVRQLEVESERRREELRSRAEADIAGVGEWARAEAERIKAEAEQRVAARRTQLEQQLAAEGARAEGEAKALRDRVAEFERELDAYHAQLAEINDPAAFAAAAKRIPRAPGTPRAAPAMAETPGAANGAAPSNVDALHAAGEEILAARLAELDATLGEGEGEGRGEGEGQAQAAGEGTAPAAQPAAAPAAAGGEPVTTEVVVKGLGSFGAITGFRQSLSGVDGVEAVTLSLGPTGEFVFRASHAPGFDLGGAITSLEGDGAKVEPRSEGGLKVTLERSR